MFQEGTFNRVAFRSILNSYTTPKVAFINAILFTLSIGAFCYILIHNALRRAAVIADAVKLPLPGCPTIHSGIEWLQWIPGICAFVSVELQLMQRFRSHDI
jgi:hypothetical protein